MIEFADYLTEGRIIIKTELLGLNPSEIKELITQYAENHEKDIVFEKEGFMPVVILDGVRYRGRLGNWGNMMGFLSFKSIVLTQYQS